MDRVQTTLREARDTLVPDLAGPQGPLPLLLLVLTVVSGLVDAFSYLALGRVFVANMTGNVLFLGFSLAGAGGFSVTDSLLSLAAFLAGAVSGGRLGRLVPGRRGRLLLTGTAVQLALVVVAVAVDASGGGPATGAERGVLIVLLALAMGWQNAVARSLKVPDLTTTVQTMTLTRMAADSWLAGGTTGRAGVRLLSALALFVGAVAGAGFLAHGHRDAPLACAAALLVLVGGVLAPFRGTAAAWAS
ncbi:YoaK family protein [Actinacidiphila rubida]